MQQAKRILLIGLGRWGANHLRVLQSMPIELSVAEHDPDRLNSSGVSQNHRSAEAHSLFPVIDAAVVVTPAPTHFEICRDLLEGGKDVFVENPISLKSAQANELVELAKRNGLILQVGHIFRFDPASVWMRDAIAQERFGEIKMLRANFSGFKRPRQDTGVTFADSIHFIDLFKFLLGKSPRRVHAVMRNFLGGDGEMDDESLIVLEYDRGDGASILATIEAGYNLPGKMRELEFPPEEPLRAELAAFLDAIETRNRPLIDGTDGMETVRVVEGAVESARTGKWIDISG